MNKIIVEEKTLSDRITFCNERHNVTASSSRYNYNTLPRTVSADYTISI